MLFSPHHYPVSAQLFHEYNIAGLVCPVCKVNCGVLAGVGNPVSLINCKSLSSYVLHVGAGLGRWHGRACPACPGALISWLTIALNLMSCGSRLWHSWRWHTSGHSFLVMHVDPTDRQRLPESLTGELIILKHIPHEDHLLSTAVGTLM